jgi:hypothetical protein
LFIVVWIGSLAALSFAWNEWLFAHQDISDEAGWAVLIGFFVLMPLVWGAIQGMFLRHSAPWYQAWALASIGAGTVALVLTGLWVNDPRSCDPSQTPCDTSAAIASLMVFAITLLPFLTGATLGKVVRRLVHRLSEHRPVS